MTAGSSDSTPQAQTQELRSTVELLQKLTTRLEVQAEESKRAGKEALTLPDLRAELRSMVSALKECAAGGNGSHGS